VSRRSKHALVVVHSYFLRDTRPQRHARALADREWGIDVVCARDKGEPLRERRDAIRIWRVPARRRGGSAARKVFEYCTFALMALFVVTAVWLRRRHRLVYVLGIPNFIVFSALLPRLLGARVLLDMRDPFPEFYLSKYGAHVRNEPPWWLLTEERLSARFASRVLTAHSSMADLYTRSVGRDRITVVLNAPNPLVFDDTGDPERDPDDRTLLYTGTVTHPYGVDLAVLAVARLHPSISRLRLRIVGHGELVETLRELARTEGVSDRVSFEQFVPLDEVAVLIRRSWLGVQPNRDLPIMRTSLSTKVLEWCRLGLPVVVGRTPPLSDAFSDDALLFHDPGDLEGLCQRIKEADADPGDLARRADRARAAVECFRFSDQIETFLCAVEPDEGKSGR
jgi:glycosyltransferase involved in cell wall biosynthesis